MNNMNEIKNLLDNNETNIDEQQNKEKNEALFVSSIGKQVRFKYCYHSIRFFTIDFLFSFLNQKGTYRK